MDPRWISFGFRRPALGALLATFDQKLAKAAGRHLGSGSGAAPGKRAR